MSDDLENLKKLRRAVALAYMGMGAIPVIEDVSPRDLPPHIASLITKDRLEITRLIELVEHRLVDQPQITIELPIEGMREVTPCEGADELLHSLAMMLSFGGPMIDEVEPVKLAVEKKLNQQDVNRKGALFSIIDAIRKHGVEDYTYLAEAARKQIDASIRLLLDGTPSMLGEVAEENLGVSLQDAAALIRVGDPKGQRKLVQKWRNSSSCPTAIGKDPEHSQRNLFEPGALLKFLKDVEGPGVDQDYGLSRQFRSLRRQVRPQEGSQ